MPKAVKKKAALAPASTLGKKGNGRTAQQTKSAAMGMDIQFDPGAQLRRAQSKRPRSLSQALSINAGPEVLNRLWSIIELRRTADPVVSHSARLLGRGTAKVAQKFGEEAVECLIEIMAGNRVAAIAESADVLYHLLVMWVEAGIRPEEVWMELEKREGASSLIEGPNGPIKRLLKSVQLRTRKIP